MNLDPQVEYVDPSVSSDRQVHRLLDEWRHAPLRLRILLTVYLAIAALGGLLGGHALISEYSNWLTWSITLLILEPVGAASLLALLLIYFPNSGVSRIFSHALTRAKLALLLIGVCIAGWFLFVAGYLALEFWKLR